jgi:hypothetical protein
MEATLSANGSRLAAKFKSVAPQEGMIEVDLAPFGLNST